MIRQLLRRLTWRTLSMLIGQVSLAAFGAHLIARDQMSDLLGLALALCIVSLTAIGALGEQGARLVVDGIRAWRSPPGEGNVSLDNTEGGRHPRDDGK